MKKKIALGIVVIVALLAAFAVYDHYRPSSSLYNPRVVQVWRLGKQVPNVEWDKSGDGKAVVVSPGDEVLLNYEVERPQSCSVKLTRDMVRRGDGETITIHYATLSFVGDNPTFLRPSSFRAKIVRLDGDSPFPPGVYDLIPHGRYYCNGLDWIWPRLNTFQSVEIEVKE